MPEKYLPYKGVVDRVDMDNAQRHAEKHSDHKVRTIQNWSFIGSVDFWCDMCAITIAHVRAVEIKEES